MRETLEIRIAAGFRAERCASRAEGILRRRMSQAVWSEATETKKKPLQPRGPEGCVWLESKKLVSSSA